jgi:hypothetical protein
MVNVVLAADRKRCITAEFSLVKIRRLHDLLYRRDWKESCDELTRDREIVAGRLRAMA